MTKKRQTPGTASVNDDLGHSADPEGAEDDSPESPLAAPERTTDPKVAALEAKIAELQAKLAQRTETVELPTDPDALIEFDVPLGPTGFAVEFNGRKIVGPGPWTRRVLDHVLHVLSVKQQSEKERLKDRGVGFRESRLDPSDYGSRAIRHRQGRHVL